MNNEKEERRGHTTAAKGAQRLLRSPGGEAPEDLQDLGDPTDSATLQDLEDLAASAAIWDPFIATLSLGPGTNKSGCPWEFVRCLSWSSG